MASNLSRSSLKLTRTFLTLHSNTSARSFSTNTPFTLHNQSAPSPSTQSPEYSSHDISLKDRIKAAREEEAAVQKKLVERELKRRRNNRIMGITLALVSIGVWWFASHKINSWKEDLISAEGAEIIRELEREQLLEMSEAETEFEKYVEQKKEQKK
jgi:hypothetical protein